MKSEKFSGLYLPMREKGDSVAVHENFAEYTDLDTGEKGVGIDEYLKTLDPEEREAREKGLWRHLSGLVYKSLDRDVHCYDDFPIPKAWMRIEGIDPHDARPTCYLFGAVSPEEIDRFSGRRDTGSTSTITVCSRVRIWTPSSGR